MEEKEKREKEMEEKEIAITKINKSNIFKVISWSFGETKEYIIELKSKELEEIVEEQTTDTILELFDNYETPDFIIDELYIKKLDIIIEAIKNSPAIIASITPANQMEFSIIKAP